MLHLNNPYFPFYIKHTQAKLSFFLENLNKISIPCFNLERHDDKNRQKKWVQSWT